MGKYQKIFTVILFLISLNACQLISNPGKVEANPTIRPINPSATTGYSAATLPARTRVPDSAQAPIVTQSEPTVTFTSIVTSIATEIPNIMCSPLQDETISSLSEIITNVFDEPPPGRDDHHHGVDFAYYRRGERLSIEGEIVQSIVPGVVAASILDRLPYGNMVIIETTQNMIANSIVEKFAFRAGESVYSLYAHMGERPEVKVGDGITCGQELGMVGITGYDIVNPHLHLETRIGPSGVRFTSMAFYDTSATTEEMDNYLLWRTSGEFRPVDPMLVFAAYVSDQHSAIKTPFP
jgi:murein DD-endopeptidase MepM/ murein hydrolase activator NlpD